jgi:hypothetical protein
MFLSCNLFIALIDVPCKSSHHIVRLPSVRDCYPDGGDCASEQDDRTRGGGEKDGMRAKVSSVQRSGRLLGRDLLCRKEEGRGFEGERCREGPISIER